MFALGDLRALGVSGSLAGALSLFSQVLIPWGGLGPGTAVGAALAGVDPARLGAVNAWLSAVWLILLLPPLWRLACLAGLPASPRDKAAGLTTLLALGALLIVASRFVGVEAAGLLALGPVLACRLWNSVGRVRAWRMALPYLLLSGLLIGTRLLRPVEWILVSLLSFRPWDDLPALAPLHHPAGLVLVVTLPFLVSLSARRAIVLTALRRAVRPSLLFLAYGALARLVGGSGAARAVARAVSAQADLLLPFLVPLFGAAGGFFTGTNVGSNALLMPIQAELAGSLGLPLVVVAAVQNFAGSAFCLVAPMRLGATAALAGEGAEPAAIGRLIGPAAGLALAVAAAAVVAARHLPAA
ncbi:MAG: L-lactate permease [Acetobacteraceae bacterium]|nr:L-lactate permease [Acetobacteraceae bacterium]